MSATTRQGSCWNRSSCQNEFIFHGLKRRIGMNDKEIFVSIQFGVETHLVGTLWCHQKNNRQSASFMYDHNWLKHPERFAIDPALQLTPGTFHTSESQLLFGAIGDSAPDRWGRVLMRRS